MIDKEKIIAQLADKLADYWDSLEDASTITGLLEAMKLCLIITNNPRLKKQIEKHESYGNIV